MAEDPVSVEAQNQRIQRFEQTEAIGDRARAVASKLIAVLEETAFERWAVCPKHGQRPETGVSGEGKCLAKVGRRLKCGRPCPRDGFYKMPPEKMLAGVERCARVTATPDVLLHAAGLGKRPFRNLVINQDNRTGLDELENAPAEVQAWHTEREKKRAASRIDDALADAEEFPRRV